MKILAVPDSFKGSLTSARICDIIESVVLSLSNQSTVVKRPLADGGEGTVDALVINTGGLYVTCEVENPNSEKIDATYGILGDNKTAVIEMASASGLMLIKSHQRNPLKASSFGTGELILDAIKKGCNRIIMGIGGSATNDGGMGMLKALGFSFLDINGCEIKDGAIGLIDLVDINVDAVSESIKNTEFIIACDVDNPLLGLNGASHVYGPQKGATDEMIAILEAALENYSDVISNKFDIDIKDIPGAGAAGGMGAGLLAFLNTTLKSGFEIISEKIGLEACIKENEFDLIITGEGEINQQTLNGKLPIGIARMAKKYKIPVIAIVGSIGDNIEELYQHGITSIFSIVNKPMQLEYSIEHAENLYEDTVKRVMKLTFEVFEKKEKY